MKAFLDRGSVVIGEEGVSLHETGGYGRREKDGLRLNPHEALYLVHRQKITVDGHTFDSLLSVFSEKREFIRAFLVYRDLRERGYAVQIGPQDFRVYRRGERPGTGESHYLVRVLSERNLIRFETVSKEVLTSLHMRKQFIHAVVDDEDELTYYAVRTLELPSGGSPSQLPSFSAEVTGTGALILSPPAAILEGWYGKPLDSARTLLSAVETYYLIQAGYCSLSRNGVNVSGNEFFSLALAVDPEFGEKARVYADLRTRGYIPRTGYKFGHHFRIYRHGKTHSEMLVQSIPPSGAVPMSGIARSVRLAHSVKKKMLFACIYAEGIQYIEFGRVKL